MGEANLQQFLDNLTAAGAELPAAKKFKLDSSALPDPTPFGYTEINKLEHCARTLQKNIRTIIDEAPDVETLNKHFENPAVDRFAKQEIRDNLLLHLVAKLKTFYKDGQLQLFDDILGNNLELNKQRKRIDSSKVEKELKITNTDVLQDPQNQTQAPQHPGLPELPIIHSGRLRARVFQHKSTTTNKTYLADLEIVLAHNERLEFLGDSVLNSLVTFILYEKFPHANEGWLSQVRSQLVSNKTLAEFSVAYGFDRKLHSNIEESSLRNGKMKIHADIFEAFIGALAMEREFKKLDDIQDWLMLLMATKLSAAAHDLEKLTPINRDAKSELYSLVGTASSHPVYKVVENGNGVHTPFKVQCMMGEDVLGEGVGPGLREAGLRAAMFALKNKPMLEKYGRQRLETDRSVLVVKQDTASESADAALTTPSGKQLPLVADKSVLANKFAKNELYAFCGKNLGMAPEYEVTFDAENNRYKAVVKLKEVHVALAYDVSKKNAMSRAATVVLENKSTWNEILYAVVNDL